MTKRLKILFIPLEFDSWHCASRWSYSCNFGIEEGLAAQDVDLVTMPAFFSVRGSVHGPGSWLAHAPRMLKGLKFDQVWIEIAQSWYDESFLEWLVDLAPVRVGMIFESLSPDPHEYVTNPLVIARRSRSITRNMPWMTHYIVSDESDFVSLRRTFGESRCFWWNCGKIGRSWIASHAAVWNGAPAQFFGSLYEKRAPFFEKPELRASLAYRSRSLELDTEYPGTFERFIREKQAQLSAASSVSLADLEHYLEYHRALRRGLFSLWMASLLGGCAIVNLPQHGRTYAGRVTEGLALGRPVVTWEVPGSESLKTLFIPGEEVLTFREDDPGQLLEHIERLREDPVFAVRLAENGRRKLLSHHTIEQYIGEVLSWIRDGYDPASVAWALLPVADKQPAADLRPPVRIRTATYSTAAALRELVGRVGLPAAESDRLGQALPSGQQIDAGQEILGVREAIDLATRATPNSSIPVRSWQEMWRSLADPQAVKSPPEVGGSSLILQPLDGSDHTVQCVMTGPPKSDQSRSRFSVPGEAN